jgi:hypothetical protein
MTTPFAGWPDALRNPILWLMPRVGLAGLEVLCSVQLFKSAREGSHINFASTLKRTRNHLGFDSRAFAVEATILKESF